MHSAVTTGKQRTQEIDRETALQTSQNEETNRIPFTLTYHPQNLAIKNVILKNFKILRDDPKTKHILSLNETKRQLSKSFTVVISPLSTRLIKPNFCFDLSHRCSTTVSLETRNLSIAKCLSQKCYETRM